MPQLDGLRALAVIGVVAYHWFPEQGHGLPLASGVQLFFVISGFLITTILLNLRHAAERGDTPWFKALRTFYARRLLRIVPLFYAVVAIGAALKIADLRQSYPWHLAYASNLRFFLDQGWYKSVAHFWSLAVEEQFYLLWPLVVFFAPRQRLLAWFTGVLLSGIAFRALFPLVLPGVRLSEILTPASFDSLALGALLSYSRHAPHPVFTRIRHHRRAIGLGAIGAYTLAVYVGGATLAIAGWTLLSLAFTVAVDACSEGVRGPVGRIVSNPGLRYLGRISYGIYLIHNLVWYPIQWLGTLWPGMPNDPLSQFGIRALLTLALASLSFHLFETPLNALKRHVPYPKPGDSVRSKSTDETALAA